MSQQVKFNKSLTYSAALTASATNTGTIYFPTDSNAIILNGKVVGQQNAVTSVAGKTGAVTLSKSDVGLGNVDNTADSSKSVKNSQYAQKIGTDSSHPQIGWSKQPVYVDSNGELQPIAVTLADAASKGVVTAMDTSGNLPTALAVSTFVNEKISSVTKAMNAVVFAGTFDADTGKITAISLDRIKGSEYISVGTPLQDSSWNELTNTTGWLWVCSKAGTWTITDSGEGGSTSTRTATLEVGDSVLFTAEPDEYYNTPDFQTIQTNVEDATTSKSGVVKVVNAASTSTTANDVYNVTGANAKINAVVSALKASFTGAASKTVTAISETNGVISVTFGDISIKKSQVSDFPTTMTPTTATSTVLGGAKLGSDTKQTVAANAVSSTASRTYAIQVNSSGQLVVNVPWTDTTYDTQITSLGTRISAVETALTWE